MKPAPLMAWLQRALMLGMLLLAPPLPAQPDLERRIDALLRQGYDRPDQAMVALQALELPESQVAATRLWLLARGMVLAQSGRDAEALGWAGALRTHARSQHDAQAEAAASLVQALSAHNAARLDVAASLAQATLDGLQPYARRCATGHFAAHWGLVDPAVARGGRPASTGRLARAAVAAAARRAHRRLGGGRRPRARRARPGCMGR
jgi:hypothetical protein